MTRRLPGQDLPAVLSLCATAAPSLTWTVDRKAAVATVAETKVRVTATKVTLSGAHTDGWGAADFDALAARVRRVVADLTKGALAPKLRRSRPDVPPLATVKRAAPSLRWRMSPRGTPTAQLGDFKIAVNAIHVTLYRGSTALSRFTVGDDLADAINRAAAKAQEPV